MSVAWSPVGIFHSIRFHFMLPVLLEMLLPSPPQNPHPVSLCINCETTWPDRSGSAGVALFRAFCQCVLAEIRLQALRSHTRLPLGRPSSPYTSRPPSFSWLLPTTHPADKSAAKPKPLETGSTSGSCSVPRDDNARTTGRSIIIEGYIER